MNIPVNSLFQTDCLALLERMDSNIVTLAYLDPPANTSTFSLIREEGDLHETTRDYLEFMSQVFLQIRRVLAPSGSIFFQSDPGSIGTTQALLDCIFGGKRFQTHLVVPIHKSHAAAGPIISHDTIIWYSKSDSFVYNPQYRPLTGSEVERYGKTDERGPFRPLALTSPASRPFFRYEWRGITPPPGHSWRLSREALEELHREGKIYYPRQGGMPQLKSYLDESSGILVGSIWADISMTPLGREDLRYPGQKPITLLDRIVQTASSPGGIVLAPFSGTGTALIAAQSNNRAWIGCDLNPKAYEIALKRMESVFDFRAGRDFFVGNQEVLASNFQVVACPDDHHTIELIDILLETRGEQRTEELFILGKPVESGESRTSELKEVKGQNPVRSISDTADEYVVAFLNSASGRIRWGIRNEDKVVVGVRLAYQQQDELRRKVSDKLCNIKPSIDPTAYRMELHPVHNDHGIVPDLFVVEIVVPTVFSHDPYFTGKDELFVKTDSGKKRLSGPEMTDWIRRRLQSRD